MAGHPNPSPPDTIGAQGGRPSAAPRAITRFLGATTWQTRNQSSSSLKQKMRALAACSKSRRFWLDQIDRVSYT